MAKHLFTRNIKQYLIFISILDKSLLILNNIKHREISLYLNSSYLTYYNWRRDSVSYLCISFFNGSLIYRLHFNLNNNYTYIYLYTQEADQVDHKKAKPQNQYCFMLSLADLCAGEPFTLGRRDPKTQGNHRNIRGVRFSLRLSRGALLPASFNIFLVVMPKYEQLNCIKKRYSLGQFILNITVHNHSNFRILYLLVCHTCYLKIACPLNYLQNIQFVFRKLECSSIILFFFLV